MSGILSIRDVQIFLGSAALALGLAWLFTPRSESAAPTWPIRVYLSLFRASAIPGLARYANERAKYPRREQFLAILFVWFFVLFVVGEFAFGCGRHGC